MYLLDHARMGTGSPDSAATSLTLTQSSSRDEATRASANPAIFVSSSSLLRRRPPLRHALIFNGYACAFLARAFDFERGEPAVSVFFE